MHDYDLIQVIALLDRPVHRWAAVLASIPTWLVIFFAYGNNNAWYAVTFIPPIVLAVMLRYRNQPTPADSKPALV